MQYHDSYWCVYNRILFQRWGHWKPDSGCEVHRRYCFPRAKDSKVVTGKKKNKRTHWSRLSRWKLNIHTEYSFLPYMEITCSYLLDVELSDSQSEIQPHVFFFFRRQSWFDISPTFVISFNIQHPKKNSSVHLQQNPWGLNDSSIDFPYDDHSYMIFPYYDGDMNHWDFSGLWGRARKGQTVDQGHPGAIDENQVMIICVLDMNLVGHFLKTYIFFNQIRWFNKNMSHECYRMQVAKYRLHSTYDCMKWM